MAAAPPPPPAPAAAGPLTVLHKLHSPGPRLKCDAVPREIVKHRLQVKQAATQLGIGHLVQGPLLGGESLADISVGRRWLLETFEDEDIRGMIATHGGNDGPACWNYIEDTMLGGRDEQEVLHNMVDELRFNGQRTVISFYSEFLTVTAAITPAIAEPRLCQMYASRFPAREYMTILTACDNRPGHANFTAYARAVNNAVQTYHQRIQIQEYRERQGQAILCTDVDVEAASAYMVDSDTVLRQDSILYKEEDDLADHLSQVLTAYLTSKGKPQQRARGSSSGPSGSSHQQKKAPPLMNIICSNCGERGHKPSSCKAKDAECPHPICIANGRRRHLQKFCWFTDEKACPEKLRSKIKKLKEDFEKKKHAHLTTCEDVEVDNPDFHDCVEMNVAIVEGPTIVPAVDMLMGFTMAKARHLRSYLLKRITDIEVARGNVMPVVNDIHDALAELIVDVASTTTICRKLNTKTSRILQSCGQAKRFCIQLRVAGLLWTSNSSEITIAAMLTEAAAEVDSITLPESYTISYNHWWEDPAQLGEVQDKVNLWQSWEKQTSAPRPTDSPRSPKLSSPPSPEITIPSSSSPLHPPPALTPPANKRRRPLRLRGGGSSGGNIPGLEIEEPEEGEIEEPPMEDEADEDDGYSDGGWWPHGYFHVSVGCSVCINVEEDTPGLRRGVIATSDMKAGRIVAICTGTNSKLYGANPADLYTLGYRSFDYAIRGDPDSTQGMWALFNEPIHETQANCVFETVLVDEEYEDYQRHMAINVVYLTRDVRRGDALTVHYGDGYARDYEPIGTPAPAPRAEPVEQDELMDYFRAQLPPSEERDAIIYNWIAEIGLVYDEGHGFDWDPYLLSHRLTTRAGQRW